MKRIDTINIRKNLFGTGKHGFHDNADLPQHDATYLSPDWLNMLQEELCNIIELENVSLNSASRRQLHDFLFNKFITKAEIGSNPNQIPSMGGFGVLDRGYGYLSRAIPSGDLATQSYVTGWYSLAGIYQNAPVTTSMTGQMLVSVRAYGAGAALIFQVWNNSGADYWIGTCEYINNKDRTVTPKGTITWKRVAYTDSNVESATKLATARKINNVVFDGTKDITIADSTKLGKTENAVSASKLQTARKINNILFDGTKDITVPIPSATQQDLDVLLYSPIPWSTTIPPTNCLAMMGQTITEKQYPKLFARYGSKLPDMRAYTVRGLDAGRGIDVDRKILSEQEDDIKSHSHQMPMGPIAVVNLNPGSGYGPANITNPRTLAEGGSETRVKSIAYLYIVKKG